MGETGVVPLPKRSGGFSVGNFNAAQPQRATLGAAGAAKSTTHVPLSLGEATEKGRAYGWTGEQYNEMMRSAHVRKRRLDEGLGRETSLEGTKARATADAATLKNTRRIAMARQGLGPDYNPPEKRTYGTIKRKYEGEDVTQIGTEREALYNKGTGVLKSQEDAQAIQATLFKKFEGMEGYTLESFNVMPPNEQDALLDYLKKNKPDEYKRIATEFLQQRPSGVGGVGGAPAPTARSTLGKGQTGVAGTSAWLGKTFGF